MVRWVDEPFTVARAETKLHQLATAERLGLSTPASVATNDPEAARAIAPGRDLVAKALSAGVGIAPFVQSLDEADVEHLRSHPTLVQELIGASADMRVVVVGDAAWCWLRRRGSDEIDWRAHDPAGKAFELVERPAVSKAAVRLTAALGLSTSVQDWLEVGPGEAVFLEVNPQGAWLFLTDSRRIVLPALAEHLQAGVTERDGVWPPAFRRLRSDFMSKEKAPSNDGVVAPTFAPATWLREVAENPAALEIARRAHTSAAAGAKAAEEKANRLVSTSLTLLTATLALGAFQLSFALQRSPFWLLTCIPVAVAFGCLVLAAYEALQVDRVGVYHDARPEDLADSANASAELLWHEELGRRLAQWTSINKHSDLMQARAWFSRALALLLAAGLVAVICRGATATGSSTTSKTTVTTTAVQKNP
jgi:hypothetical protein